LFAHENEEKIVELLAEMLKKQDQHSGVLEKQSKILVDGFGKMTGVLDKYTGMFEAILVKLDTLIDHEKRIGRLEDKVFKS